MINERMSKSYFDNACAKIKTLPLLMESSQYNVVVREAQESVELLLKAALRFVGVEPARSHEVSEILRSSKERFPQFFSQEIENLTRISSELGEKRGPAFYGDEDAGVPPGELFAEEEGKKAIEDAIFIRNLCQKLIKNE